MKSHVTLTCCCLNDFGQWCGVQTQRDCKTVTQRVEHEGLSFLTITLPAFAKDLERSIADGRVSDDRFLGFSRDGGLPRFMGGFLRRVFDATAGTMLPHPSADCVLAIRQVCYLWKKLEVDPTPSRVRAAFSGFKATEDHVRSWMRGLNSPGEAAILCDLLSSSSEAVFGPVWDTLERRILDGDLSPKHGPGAVSDRLVGNQKWTNCTWTERLEELFPYGEYASASHSDYLAKLDSRTLTWLTPGAEPPVRVISVPKTQKTPRIIAIEPTWMQYVQQALMRAFVPLLEEHSRGVIGFTDQGPNQVLAREGSLHGTSATLDLSEASDRVNIAHVNAIFARRPVLRQAVFAARSAWADVPGEGLIFLSKYASMGSALTFPIEAIVHTLASFIGICRSRSEPLTSRSFRKIAAEGRFRVYGDDILLPVDATLSAIHVLESLGMKVNVDKSFWTGKFRESCGRDYFAGQDVTPVYLRHAQPEGTADAAGIAHYVSVLNQFLSRGFDEDSSLVLYLTRMLQRLIPLPHVGEESRGLGIISPPNDRTVDKVHKRFQVPLVRAAYLDAPLPANRIGGYDALLKCLVTAGDEPKDIRHLQRSGRPPRVRMKVGYVRNG